MTEILTQVLMQTGKEESLRILITVLFAAVLAFLSRMFYNAFYRMARVYNWDGNRYRYLGYSQIRKENGDFAMRIGERMLDLSRTTVYRICPSRAFCRKNRCRNLFVYADGGREHLVIDGAVMKTEIPF